MDQVRRHNVPPTRSSTCLGLGGRGKGAARKRDGVSNFEEDIDAEEGEEEEVQPAEMDTDNWTVPDAQVPLSADTQGATQG